MSKKLQDSVENAIKDSSISKENPKNKPIMKNPKVSSYSDSKVQMKDPQFMMEYVNDASKVILCKKSVEEDK